MKKSFLMLIIITTLLPACANTYFKAGVGYKVQETEILYLEGNGNHPISARFEYGIEKGNVSMGISHHSQWLVGFPFNNDGEYQKTELFVDYKFEFGE